MTILRSPDVLAEHRLVTDGRTDTGPRTTLAKASRGYKRSCLCGARLNREAEAVTKTYAVHAVVDVKNKKRLNFREAIDKNIFDPDAGSYTNTATGEKLYVGDAIRKGFIKVTLITRV